MATETFDKVICKHIHTHGGRITNVHDQQAGAIADASPAAGSTPTQAEFNSLVTKFNSLLAAMRSGTGVGIVASS